MPRPPKPCDPGCSIYVPCKVCKTREYLKQWHLDRPDYAKEQSKQWQFDNPGWSEQYYLDNKEHEKQRSAKWYQDNKEHYLKNDRQRKRKIADAGFCCNHPDRPAVRKGYCSECQVKNNLRRRLHAALKGVYKDKTTEALLGCTWAEYRVYLESLFLPGMTWDNYGRYGWHVDHIRPVSSFDFSDPEQQKLCSHYSNLQPLWAADNIKKSDNWAIPQAA